MSLTDLMIDLAARGIQLEARGDRLRYSPKTAMTPELNARVKTHKSALLAILSANDVPAAALWHAALDHMEASEAFPSEQLAACRRASVEWESEPPTGDDITELAGTASNRQVLRCDRCRSTDYRDTLIHEGRSTRLDCAQCGRFIAFPKWYEKNTLQNE